MRNAAVTLALATCLLAHGAEGGPSTQDANASEGPFYQRLARRGAAPRTGAVEPGKVGDRPVIYAARFDAAGRRLVTSTRDAVHVWTVPGMEPAQRSLTLQQPVQAADLSPDGTLLLTVDGSGQLLVRQVGVEEPLWGRRLANGCEWAAFNPDGRSVLLIEHGKNTVHLLDAASGKHVLAIRDETSEGGLKGAISRDGARIVTSSLGPTRVWSAATGNPVSSAPRFGDVFAISPAGDRVAGLSNAGEISILDAVGGKALAAIKAERRGDSQVANVQALAFSPDGRFVATSNDDLGVRVWHATTGKPASPRMKPAFENNPFSSVLFTPDGRRVVLSNSYGAGVWDVSTGTLVAAMDQAIHGWPAPVGTAVTPDGRYVAVNFGGPVELWARRR